MLAWLCSMLNTGSKLWLAPVRSSDVLACSRSLQARHVLCWIKSAALHAPCPALLSTSLCLILYSCNFAPEEPLSHLIWYEPQVVAHQPKLLANSFIQFTTFFLEEKGNSCLSKDQSQTAGRLVVQPARLLQPPAAARLSRQQRGLGPRLPEARHPAPVGYLNPPDPQIHLLLPALCTPACVWLRLFPKALRNMVIHMPPYSGTGSGMGTVVPGHAWLCLLAPVHQLFITFEALLLPGKVTSLSFLLKPSTVWVIQTSLKADIPLATASSYQRMLNFWWGVAYEQSPLAWSIGPVIPVCRFHAGAVLRSIVFSWSVFLLITHLYESVLALCQSSCQCECNCQGLYIYFTDENL